MKSARIRGGGRKRFVIGQVRSKSVYFEIEGPGATFKVLKFETTPRWGRSRRASRFERLSLPDIANLRSIASFARGGIVSGPFPGSTRPSRGLGRPGTARAIGSRAPPRSSRRSGPPRCSQSTPMSSIESAAPGSNASGAEGAGAGPVISIEVGRERLFPSGLEPSLLKDRKVCWTVSGEPCILLQAPY